MIHVLSEIEAQSELISSIQTQGTGSLEYTYGIIITGNKESIVAYYSNGKIIPEKNIPTGYVLLLMTIIS